MMNVIIWSLALIIFAIYCLTISPSIAGGDSGEIVAEGCHLGTAHPPGYPLMTLLVYGITQLPSSLMNNIVDLLRNSTGSPVVRDTVALRVNMFCAACTSLAAVYMGYVIRALTPNGDSDKVEKSFISSLPGIIIGMLMFGFSPLIWQYAITAEVFPLNTFLAAYIVWLVVDFSQRRQVSIAIYGAFICGLALCNQHTIILYEAPLILWMLFLLRRVIMTNYTVFIKLSIAFIIGIFPYAYLPTSAIISPKAGSWGHVATFQGFLHHFLRKDYGTFQLFSGNGGKKTEGFLERTQAYLRDANETQGLSFAPYLALGGIMMSIYWIFTCETYGTTTTQNNNVAGIVPTQSSTTPVVTEKMKQKKASNASNNSSKGFTPATIRNIASSESDLMSESECRYTGLVLVITQIFYFAVFHSLSNLPLSDKLLYGVHQRFWMQPNVLLFTLVGLGLNFLSVLVKYLLSPSSHKANSKKLDEKVKGRLQALNQNKNAPKKSSVQIDDESTKEETINADNTSKSASPLVSMLVSFVSLVIALFASYKQLDRWYEFSNQSQVDYFKQYAQAILTPLPENAILIVNYDQQWTSIRYLQLCENYRSDITTLQLSMMTYKWFQHKHDLYRYNNNSSKPDLIFPGTYSTYPNSPAIARDNAFTLLQFLDVNYDRHEIFLGGKVTHPDDKMAAKYDMVPVGLVSKFVQMSHVPNGTVYSNIAHNSWSTVRSKLPVLPDGKKYPEETWEWTIGRDYKDRLMDTAAYVLASAIQSASQDGFPLIKAIYWLESAYAIEGIDCPSSLLKNLGLAHLHSVQNKLIPDEIVIQDVVEDILGSKLLVDWPPNGQRWKEWSANKFVQHWGNFLKRPDANRDPQFSTIEKMYTTAVKNANMQPKQQAAGRATTAKPKPKP